MYIDSLFIQDLENGLFAGSCYGYTIEAGRENVCLSIVSTSLSEIETGREGLIAEYIYTTEAAALADIQAATNENRTFDKI